MAPKKPARAAAPQVTGSWIAAVADPHVHNFSRFGGAMVDGLNDRGRETVAALERAVRLAEARECLAFVVLGDLSHVRRPDPAILAAIQRVFANTDMSVIVLPGNHDCLDAHAAGGNTACAPLWGSSTVVSVPTWYKVGGVALLAVPFDGRRPMREVIADAVSTPGRPDGCDRYVLATHVGVYDEEGAPPWMRRARDAVVARELQATLDGADIGLALVGNYHEHRVWVDPALPTVAQVGTLCPASFSDPYEGSGRVALLSRTGGLTFEEVAGPRFVTVEAGGKSDYGRSPAGSRYYVRVRGGSEAPDLDKFRHDVAALEWQPEVSDVTEPGAGPISETAEQAIARWVQQSPEASRGSVADLVGRAWREGA